MAFLPIYIISNLQSDLQSAYVFMICYHVKHVLTVFHTLKFLSQIRVNFLVTRIVEK